MSWKLRANDVDIPVGRLAPDYGANKDFFTIRIHHSGRFLTKPKLTYVGGEVCHIDYCNVDELSKIEVDSMVSSIGLSGCLQYYYSCTGVDDVDILSPILSDSHALELGLFDGGVEDRIVGLFVDHEKLSLKDIVFPPDQPEGSEHVDGEEGSNIHVHGVEGSSMQISHIIDSNDSGESDGDVSVGEDSDNSDYFGDSEGVYDIDNRDFDSYVDSDEEWGGLNLKNSKGKKLVSIPEKNSEVADMNNQVVGFNSRRMAAANITLSLGMCFLDANEFRKVLRDHAIQMGRDLIFPINNRYKVQAKCKNKDCQWLVYGSRGKNDDTFMIRTIYEKHTCPRLNKVVHATSKFLAEKYKEDLQCNPKWPTKAMMKKLVKENKVSFSKAQLYRCKKKVANLGDDGSDQYSILWRYAEEILHTNPGSTIRIKCKYIDGDVVFKRLYLCWDALKKGMLDGCRRIICLDGCHLKTIHGGVLLSAVGLDSNNGIYPFAYAIVEKEKKKSWLWFLDLVIRDLEIQNSALWTIMSDKQKGLVDAVSEKLPDSEHRFCVVHLYANFKLLHNGLALKNLLWKAARATRVIDFNMAMAELRSRNVAAFEWLQKRDPKHWSRSHFTVLNKTDLLYNNLSESFNSMILETRIRPILQLLEGIRLILMLRIGLNRQEMLKHSSNICPCIEVILETNKERSHNYTALWNGENEFNVEYSCTDTVAFKVHLGDRTCSCRRWDLTGIPCAHAICCMYYMGHHPEEYIDDCYKKETYLRVYSHFLHPLSSKEEWPTPEGERCKIQPPRVTKMPGRPKKHARKLQPGERRPSQNPSQISAQGQPKKFGKLPRRGVVLSCTTCGVSGHNSRTCAPKRGNGLDIPAPNTERQKGKRKKKTPAGGNTQEVNTQEGNTQTKKKCTTSGKALAESSSNIVENATQHIVINENLRGMTPLEDSTMYKPVKKQKLQVRGKGKKIESSTTTNVINLGSRKDYSWFECSKGKTISQPTASGTNYQFQKHKKSSRGAVHVPGAEEAPTCSQQ